jgi:hypothetical protein
MGYVIEPRNGVDTPPSIKGHVDTGAQVVGEVNTKYLPSGVTLDPVLAEVLFTWKRAPEFGREKIDCHISQGCGVEQQRLC